MIKPFIASDLREISPLVLAYIGDAVYDLVVRSVLVNRGNTAVNNLHKRASAIVKAHGGDISARTTDGHDFIVTAVLPL